MLSYGVRKASSSADGESRSESTPQHKRGRKRREKDTLTQDETKPHPQNIADAVSELEMSPRLKGARKSIMRETVGKGKVDLVPIAILPDCEALPPQQFQLGTKARLDYRTILQTRPGLRGRRVFTNENFIKDTFESRTLGSWAGPEEVSSMTSNVEPGVSELVSYLVTEVGVSRKDASQYISSAPSLLGVSKEELRGVAEELEGLGFSRKQVARLLPVFPSSLSVDWANVREVYLLLNKEVKMAEQLVMSLMKRHPFIFTLPCSKVSIPTSTTFLLSPFYL